MEKLLKIDNKEKKLLKSYTNVNYDSKNVLANSTFDFIELFLMRKCKVGDNSALFYWRQAKNFYLSTLTIPVESKPLTAYYCCMNAAKALLSIRNIPTINISHGVSSSRNDTKGDIASDKITFNGSGVLWELSKILGDSLNKEVFVLQDLFYNLVCIHRTFTITFSSFTELFIPISDVCFQFVNNSSKVYAKFYVDQEYSHGLIKRYIPNCFENVAVENELCYRYKKRFKWDIHTPIKDRLNNLNAYHAKIRRNFHCICGNDTLWYIKKHLPGNRHIIDRSSMTIIYGIFHWLSELVRYNPASYSKLLSSKQNWLIREFVDIGLSQFINEIGSEITGLNIINNNSKSYINNR